MPWACVCWNVNVVFIVDGPCAKMSMKPVFKDYGACVEIWRWFSRLMVRALKYEDGLYSWCSVRQDVKLIFTDYGMCVEIWRWPSQLVLRLLKYEGGLQSAPKCEAGLHRLWCVCWNANVVFTVNGSCVEIWRWSSYSWWCVCQNVKLVYTDYGPCVEIWRRSA